MSALPLGQLLRLVSPTLPVGAYSYSQGLEWAIEAGDVRDEATAFGWIRDSLVHVVGRCEAPVALRLHRAWAAGDAITLRHWNHFLLATRETAELHAETLQMGYSLRRLIGELGSVSDDRLTLLAALEPCSYPAAFACAAHSAGIAEGDMVHGMLWAFAENQVMAALKAVPLGQTAGQRMLCAVIETLPGVVESIFALADDELCNFAPGFAIASSRHETQYSRLFRS